MNRLITLLRSGLFISCVILLVSCQANDVNTSTPQAVDESKDTPTSSQPTELPVTPTSLHVSVTEQPSVDPTISINQLFWEAKGLPVSLLEQIAEILPGTTVEDGSEADIQVTAINSGDAEVLAEWIYVVVTPFPTIEDEVNLAEIQKAWRGEPVGKFGGNPLLMSEETKLVWQEIWGEPVGDGIKIAGEVDLLSMAWEQGVSWAIIPFQLLDPRWKALRVDGVSIFDNDISGYSLMVKYGLSGSEKTISDVIRVVEEADMTIPITNRDPNKLTTLMLTGVTALSRFTAAKMEENGVTYPGELVRDWMESADLTHVSNEVPFFSGCPSASPVRTEARFCSDPSYINLLKYTGVDIIELTGNHLKDWGSEALLETLDLYQAEGFQFYGGGYNLENATIPLEIENHGNRLVFLGCNAMGPESDWATSNSPGSAPCDLDQLEKEVETYVGEGYLPIVTFQHFEICEVTPQSGQRADFTRIAEAGAVIVSGSQAHCPQGMTFVGDSFVHYGLGNLFFDQMDSEYGRGEFLDRHVFYDGRYISTELLTAKLEDYAQPRPMTDTERRNLLETVFEESVWNFE